MADIGELIGGYKLRALLQTGQTSQVFEVVEPHSNRHFAMKLLLPEKVADEEQRAALFHEAEVGVKLTHPNVIRIVKVNRSKEAPHFIMEFFPSGSLRLRLQAKDAAFIRRHARRIFREAATGLAYMNAMGYVHRDVKPDNILVNPVGETKIIDFAITKKRTTGGLFGKRLKPQGTPSFMSPEQIKGDPQDGRADIYSFGCTVYELTTGKKPFTAASQQELLTKHFTEKPYSPASHNKDLTDEFGAFVLKMLAKKPADRFPSFHEVLIALQKIKIYKDEKPEEEEAEPASGFGGMTAPAAKRPAEPEPEEEPGDDARPVRPAPPPVAGQVPFDPDNIDIDSL
ncbi:MAG: serine/threonine protein kinase [Gemmataceae bacterium]|nr:serine/threonine protein kinase [Gemmataceae bacterium]